MCRGGTRFGNSVNSTPHTSHFSLIRHAHAWLKSYVWRAHLTPHASSPCAHVVCLILFDFSTFLSLLSIFSPIVLSFLLAINFIFHDVCTAANEDLGTLAEYDPLTGYEPNDYHISETTEPYIQESSGENGSLNDLEYDDVTIGMALSSPLFTKEREDDASR